MGKKNVLISSYFMVDGYLQIGWLGGWKAGFRFMRQKIKKLPNRPTKPKFKRDDK